MTETWELKLKNSIVHKWPSVKYKIAARPKS